MAYPAAAIANAFIDMAFEQGFFLTNLKLQKMVYFAHGWHLALTDQPLIVEEIQSWQYGPVVQLLYNDLRQYGANPVTEKIRTTVEVIQDSEIWNFLHTIYEKYSVFSPYQLIAMTHEPGSPWNQFGAGQNDFEVIPNDAIKIYFKKMLKNGQ